MVTQELTREQELEMLEALYAERYVAVATQAVFTGVLLDGYFGRTAQPKEQQ